MDREVLRLLNGYSESQNIVSARVDDAQSLERYVEDTLRVNEEYVERLGYEAGEHAGARALNDPDLRFQVVIEPKELLQLENGHAVSIMESNRKELQDYRGEFIHAKLRPQEVDKLDIDGRKNIENVDFDVSYLSGENRTHFT